MPDPRSICVFCGSSPGHDPIFAAHAVAVGRLLATNRIRLVYGGSSVGLMGQLADSALAEGGEVVGVIPRGLFSREVAHTGLTELVEVDTMHQRKLAMFERSDAFVALPGGLGTLEELSEIVSWAQLGIHSKPIATLDVAGFWQPFHAFVRQAADRGFVSAANTAIISNVTTVESLLDALRSYQVRGRRRLSEPEDG
jgi:uncharacterized protein (TIGR00730 family)